MRYYPLLMDIAGRRCVVIGGGAVAERKVKRLLACDARVEVVAGSLTPLLEAMSREGYIVCRDNEYRKSVLTGAFLAIGATDDEEVNGRVAADARELGIPVNIVDAPDLCSFILPSVAERGDLCIAVSTAGRSPALAKKIGMELQENYGEEYGILVEILGELRKKVVPVRYSIEERQDLFESVVYSAILEHIRAGEWDAVRELILDKTGIDMEVKPR